MHDTLSGRAEELGRLTDLIRTSLSLADSSIPAINAQLDELAAMGLGPAAGCGATVRTVVSLQCPGSRGVCRGRGDGRGAPGAPRRRRR